jgi:hypothetical protein
MWIPGYKKMMELPKEVQLARQKRKKELVPLLCKEGSCALRDAAWFSAGHRLREIYTSHFMLPPCPLVPGRDAADVLDDDHQAQIVSNHHTGGFPFAPGNLPGQMRSKMPTRMRRYDTESMEMGFKPGRVIQADDGELVRPRLKEVERIVGFYASWAPNGITWGPSVNDEA